MAKENPTDRVLAEHTSGKQEYVPLEWMDEKRSPFPGQWTRVAVEEPEEKQSVQPTAAGDAQLPEATKSPEDLKGAELDAALKDAGLPVTGKADEKRQRLADATGQSGQNEEK